MMIRWASSTTVHQQTISNDFCTSHDWIVTAQPQWNGVSSTDKNTISQPESNEPEIQITCHCSVSYLHIVHLPRNTFFMLFVLTNLWVEFILKLKPWTVFLPVMYALLDVGLSSKISLRLRLECDKCGQVKGIWRTINVRLHVPFYLKTIYEESERGQLSQHSLTIQRIQRIPDPRFPLEWKRTRTSNSGNN